MNMCPTPNGFHDRAIWMYNRKIVDRKEIVRVRTVSNTSIYCSSHRVGTVYNKCSKNSSVRKTNIKHRKITSRFELEVGHDMKESAVEFCPTLNWKVFTLVLELIN